MHSRLGSAERKHVARSAYTTRIGLLFTTLRGLRRVQGSGARRAQGSGAPARLILSVLATTFGTIACTAAPALAALEKPETGKATAITATTATLEEGVLNPNAKAGVEGGEWQFLYAVSETQCEGQSAAPEPAGIAAGLPKEALPPVKLTNLQPSAKYTFCLIERNVNGTSPASTPATFETKPAPPTVTRFAPLSVQATKANLYEARLYGQLNPNNQEVPGCEFQYGTEASLATSTTVPCEQHNMQGFGEYGVAVNVNELTQHTTYYYRVIAKNVNNEETIGEVETFTTPTPEPPETKVATEVTFSSAKLNGILNPRHEGVKGTYQFLYNDNSGECKGGSRIPEPAGEALGHEHELESVEVTGLLPGTEYTFCLLARNEAGEEALGPPETFTTFAVPPTVGGGSVSSIGSSSATLHAQVDPGGAQTTYLFEYGPNYELKTPLASAGAGSEPVSVLAAVEELQPEKLYHSRVVASNEKAPGGVSGGDESFSTFPVGVLGLPDGRSYELVSPLANQGDAAVLPGQAGEAEGQAAADGSAVTYIGSAPPVGGRGLAGVNLGRPVGNNKYLATRSATGGWTTTDVQPDNLETVNYLAFSSDLSMGILTSEQALTGGAPNGEGHEGLYSRDNNDGGYQLLDANASYEGSTVNGSHILLKSGAGGGLYDSVAGQLYPVNVLPEGGSAPEASFGSPAGDLEGAISTDGSRIFWTDLKSTGTYSPPILLGLFARENDTSPAAKTVQIDASTLPGTEKEKAEKGGRGDFWGASSDGSRVFFTDEKALTSSSSAAAGAPDLYEYDLEDGALTDLSVDTNSGEHADVGGVLGASRDGSYVYFAAAGVLGESAKEGAKPQECLTSKCNVYVVHEGEAPKLVATVSAADDTEQVFPYEKEGMAWGPEIGDRDSYVTPDGRQLVFESVENLTGTNGKGGREIYMYDFGSGVSCLSCNPTGVSVNKSGGNLNHAQLPLSGNSTYALQDVSADGDLVFFLSNEKLVSQDSNQELTPLGPFLPPEGPMNVYEWERDGSGSCTRDEGCVYLLSRGTSTDNAYFVDASESGEDVFIETRAQLVPQDHGETFEIYDARVDAPQEPTPSACSGSGCQGVPGAPPIFATPSSETFDGVGNFPPAPAPEMVAKKTVRCAKGKKLSHGKCVKKKSGKTKGAKRATNDRRAK